MQRWVDIWGSGGKVVRITAQSEFKMRLLQASHSPNLNLAWWEGHRIIRVDELSVGLNMAVRRKSLALPGIEPTLSNPYFFWLTYAGPF
jgi:hypothetical protein